MEKKFIIASNIYFIYYRLPNEYYIILSESVNKEDIIPFYREENRLK